MTYDIAVLIGRFQPFHLADTRNPWSSEEKQAMISAVLTAEQLQRVSFIPRRQHLDSDNFGLADVQQKVLAESEDADRVVLMGHRRGRSRSMAIREAVAMTARKISGCLWSTSMRTRRRSSRSTCRSLTGGLRVSALAVSLVAC